MKLGFVSAILPDLPLDQVLAFAGSEGYACVELMCWPPGKAERRYAGVTHLDVTDFSQSAADDLRALAERHGTGISSLGYYPNPLSPDERERAVAAEHLRRVIDASALLGLGLVTTFVGRDPGRSVDAQWPDFLATWRPLVAYAAERGVRIGIENCPMLFTNDEWPGGKNLATSPAIWRRMFSDVGSDHLGLNYDPSHMIWQKMDHIAPIHEFRDRIFHIHAKDARIDRAALDAHGVLSPPKLWHTPKLPGMGDVRWGAFFAALGDIGYAGAVAVEVEDRSFEGSLERRKASLVQSRRYLQQFVV
jgi:sugar phosphate isomerase/epimerase